MAEQTLVEKVEKKIEEKIPFVKELREKEEILREKVTGIRFPTEKFKALENAFFRSYRAFFTLLYGPYFFGEERIKKWTKKPIQESLRYLEEFLSPAGW